MSHESNQQKRVVLLLAVWGVLLAVAIVHPLLTAPTGDSFTRGWNRFIIMLTWQAVTFAVAVVVFVIARRVREQLSRRIRTAAVMPLIIHGIIVLAAIGFVAYAVMNAPNG